METVFGLRKALAAALVLASALGSCSSGGPEAGERAVLRLGYFPNITHAPGIVGVSKGMFAAALGSEVRFEPMVFNAGPDAVSAIFSDALDATYIGPNPAINAFAKSKGEAIRIVAGATSGGAFLVVKPSITRPQDLAGTTIATPQLGNTQDVALRSWLASNGFNTTLEGAGDVKVVPQENSQTVETFASGTIDGAWVPEPFASRMILDSGGMVLVDERDLWPDGKYVTTQLVVRTAFLREHPDIVRKLLQGHVAAIDFLNDEPAAAKSLVRDALGRLTGKPLSTEVLGRAWSSLSFTTDPIASSLRTSAAAAVKLGLLEPVSLDGIYDLSFLNEPASSPSAASS